MKCVLVYIGYILKHKWFVFLAGLKLGVPFWQLVMHDMSKFGLSEFGPYARYFYGTYPKAADISYTGHTKESTKADFDIAWLHHQKRNKHHWQYWILQYDQGSEWGLQEMNVESPKIIAHDGKPLLWCEADPLFSDDQIHSMAFKLCANVVYKLNTKPVTLKMPYHYQSEMLADWMGAGRALGKPDTLAWYISQRNKMMLHTETRAWIEQKLGYFNDGRETR